MRYRFLFILLLFAHCCSANMSSPYYDGTRTGSAFSSKNIDILREDITVHIDSSFSTAQFVVEYTVQNDTTGMQIPLLFVAENYKDSFRVWTDSTAMLVKNVPDEYRNTTTALFARFPDMLLKQNTRDGGSPEVSIGWDENSRYVYNLNELKYFETILGKGVHTIRVTYTAKVWEDISDWVAVYSFRYSLTPAKFWKSFGSLHLRVYKDGKSEKLFTNLGAAKDSTAGFSEWTFNKLPDEYFELTYTPEISNLAQVLIAVSPFWMMVICGLILGTLHIWGIIWYRKKTGKLYGYSPVVIIGSILLPLVPLFCYMYAFDLIDHVIGIAAGRHHGYTFFILVLYPVVMPVYWTLMWLIDRRVRRR